MLGIAIYISKRFMTCSRIKSILRELTIRKALTLTICNERVIPCQRGATQRVGGGVLGIDRILRNGKTGSYIINSIIGLNQMTITRMLDFKG
jgi:hypothetical protein